MKFNRRADGACLTCFDKKTTDAQILNSRRVFSSATAPDGPHTLGRFNASVAPPGVKNIFCQAALAMHQVPSASEPGAGTTRLGKREHNAQSKIEAIGAYAHLNVPLITVGQETTNSVDVTNRALS